MSRRDGNFPLATRAENVHGEARFDDELPRNVKNVRDLFSANGLGPI